MARALLILAVTLMVGANCAKHSVSQRNGAGIGQATRTPETPSPTASNVSSAPEKESVPVEFSGIDFKNLSYRISSKPGAVRLKDGRVEFFQDKYLGNSWFEFEGVNYVDLTGDGKKEAIVRLSQVICGGSCDGSSALLYFFSASHGAPVLLSRIETGSVAYTCGLKAFVLSERTLVLDAFRTCTFDGVSFKSAYDAEERGGKFIAREFTRFTLEFDKGKFVAKKREVLPNPEIDVKNYPAKISISHE